MHSDFYKWIWFNLDMVTDTIVHYILMLNKLTLILIQSRRSVWMLKLLRQLSHKVFQSVWMELACNWDLLVWWTSYSFYLVHSVFKGENPTYMILLEKNFFLNLKKQL